MKIRTPKFNRRQFGLLLAAAPLAQQFPAERPWHRLELEPRKLFGIGVPVHGGRARELFKNRLVADGWEFLEVHGEAFFPVYSQDGTPKALIQCYIRRRAS